MIGQDRADGSKEANLLNFVHHGMRRRANRFVQSASSTLTIASQYDVQIDGVDTGNALDE